MVLRQEARCAHAENFTAQIYNTKTVGSYILPVPRNYLTPEIYEQLSHDELE